MRLVAAVKIKSVRQIAIAVAILWSGRPTARDTASITKSQRSPWARGLGSADGSPFHGGVPSCRASRPSADNVQASKQAAWRKVRPRTHPVSAGSRQADGINAAASAPRTAVDQRILKRVSLTPVSQKLAAPLPTAVVSRHDATAANTTSHLPGGGLASRQSRPTNQAAKVPSPSRCPDAAQDWRREMAPDRIVGNRRRYASTRNQPAPGILPSTFPGFVFLPRLSSLRDHSLKHALNQSRKARLKELQL